MRFLITAFAFYFELSFFYHFTLSESQTLLLMFIFLSVRNIKMAVFCPWKLYMLAMLFCLLRQTQLRYRYSRPSVECSQTRGTIVCLAGNMLFCFFYFMYGVLLSYFIYSFMFYLDTFKSDSTSLTIHCTGLWNYDHQLTTYSHFFFYNDCLFLSCLQNRLSFPYCRGECNKEHVMCFCD